MLLVHLTLGFQGATQTDSRQCPCFGTIRALLLSLRAEISAAGVNTWFAQGWVNLGTSTAGAQSTNDQTIGIIKTAGYQESQGDTSENLFLAGLAVPIARGETITIGGSTNIVQGSFDAILYIEPE